MRKAAVPDDAVYRLTDMVTEEVSLVDRAANKRKFLVVKNDAAKGSEMSKALAPDGKGGLTAAKVMKSSGAEQPDDEDEKKKDAKKAALEVPPGFKQIAGPLLAKVSDRLTALADTVNGATEAELGDDGTLPGIPEQFLSELESVGALLAKLSTLFPVAAPEVDEAALEGAALDPPEDLAMRLKAVAKNLGIDGASLVKKVGAKMSKERLTRLEQAANVILSLIGEMQPVATPAGESVKSAKSADSTLSDALSKIDGRLVQITESYVKMADVVQKHATELATLRKARSGGNTSTPEASQRTAKSAEPFSWPIDMNDDPKGSKHERFFED